MTGVAEQAERTRVFLAGSRHAIEPVRRALVEEGFLATAPATIPVGEIWTEHLLRAVAASDLFIALLDPPKDPPETFYELGLAEGMGKPTLLVASPQTRLPVDLTGRVVIRPGDDLVGAVLYAVRHWQVARRVQIAVGAARQQGGRVLGPEADDLLAELDRIEGAARRRPHGGPAAEGVAFEQVIHNALSRSTDAVAVAGDLGRDSTERLNPLGPDLGVWADALADSLGNPLLVELKLSLPTRSSLEQTVGQLNDYLSSSSARSGLLVYLSAPRATVQESLDRLGPPVYAISAHTLIEGLRSRSLAEVLRDLARASQPDTEG